ncbi:MAG: hypothetical protein LC713_03020, partial [Actinobacteria bacterium]|nr:hypothetical protein [Actinomycetota bacterium]
MGWTGGQLRGPRTALNLIEFELGSDLVARTIATAKIGGVVYAAVRSSDDKEAVWALVLLTEAHGGITYTKAMDETQGPCETTCPARILDLLTGTTSEYALAWRQACREHAAKPRPAKGQTVRFAQPVAFTNGHEYRDLVYSGGARFTTLDGIAVYLSRWRERAYEIVR